MRTLDIKEKSHKILVSPTDIPPTDERFNVIGVFNPAAVRFNNEIILLVRVAQSLEQDFPNFLYSPRSTIKNNQIEYVIDKLELQKQGDSFDHRKPITKTGHKRLAFISHLEMVRLESDGQTVKEIVRLNQLFGNTPYEEFGVEDARITKIDDTFYITYVGVSSIMGVCTHLMTTKDFVNFERKGIMFLCENKDVVIYPEKIGGLYHCLNRPVGNINISDLAIVHSTSPDLIHWGNHSPILSSTSDKPWYSSRIGAGTPPIKTKEGWLSLFHGVRKRGKEDATGEYTAGAMLTDLNDPRKLLALSDEPFFVPQDDFEKVGFVNDVVFPTGVVIDDKDPDLLHVYYGATDTYIAVKSYSIKEILDSLQRL